MGEAHGIKETKEALHGILALSVVLAGVLKDGAQLSDLSKLFDKMQNDEELKTKLEAAWKDVVLVQQEASDIDLSEGVELLMEAVPYVPKLIEAMKK